MSSSAPVRRATTSVLHYLCQVINELAAAVPTVNKKVLSHDVIGDIKNPCTTQRLSTMWFLENFRAVGNENNMFPVKLLPSVVVVSRPRSDAVVHSCLENSAKEMDRTGNTIVWGIYCSQPSDKFSILCFHAINRDRDGVYYETENRPDAVRGQRRAVFFPYDFNEAHYRTVLHNWKRHLDCGAEQVRFDTLLFKEGDAVHVVVEKGRSYDEDGRRSYIARLTAEGDEMLSEVYDDPLTLNP
jgi:hypothetical protein